MIAYLAELWNEGEQEPFLSFLKDLDIEAPATTSKYRSKLEYNNIDLAIFLIPEGEVESLFLLVEMKVDDREGWKKLSKREIKDALPLIKDQSPYFSQIPDKGNPYLIQTEMYTFRERLHELSGTYLLITVGNGEFYDSFVSPQNIWRAVRLKAFASAINKISNSDLLIQQWSNALDREVHLRQNCWNELSQDGQEGSPDDRHRLLTMMRLGELRHQLLQNKVFRTLGCKPRVYKANTDTILNFALPDSESHYTGFRFCEINSNGYLNFKIYFHKSHQEKKERQVYFDTYAKDLANSSIPEDDWLFPRTRRGGKSRTVRSIDLGLNKYSLTLKEGFSLDRLVDKITSTLLATQSIIHYGK